MNKPKSNPSTPPFSRLLIHRILLYLGKKSGSYVEWYKENDGGAAVVKLTIRYSGVAADGRPLELLLQANDQASTELHLPTTVNWGSQWRTVTTQVTLKPGANTIRLTTTGDRGPFIDEIRFE